MQFSLLHGISLSALADAMNLARFSWFSQHFLPFYNLINKAALDMTLLYVRISMYQGFFYTPLE